jgi:hypothetical protein
MNLLLYKQCYDVILNFLYYFILFKEIKKEKVLIQIKLCSEKVSTQHMSEHHNTLMLVLHCECNKIIVIWVSMHKVLSRLAIPQDK